MSYFRLMTTGHLEVFRGRPLNFNESQAVRTLSPAAVCVHASEATKNAAVRRSFGERTQADDGTLFPPLTLKQYSLGARK